jgi:tRNA-intron endonuclease
MAKKKAKAETHEKEKKPEAEKEKKESYEKEKKETIRAFFEGERIITENSDLARELYNHSRYGEILDDQRVQLSVIETLYLLDKGKILLYDSRNKLITFDSFLKRVKKLETKIWTKFCVFKDIRNRGYIVKTALKFGADFRVYDRGVKPGDDHARWVVYPVHEGETLTWHEFSAKNRVAHSTKKRLLVGCVDLENSVTYWEIRWIRP